MISADDTEWANLYELGEPQSRVASPRNSSGGFPQTADGSKAENKQALDSQNALKVLPFEFIALEACLEAACSCLDNEVLYAYINKTTHRHTLTSI